MRALLLFCFLLFGGVCFGQCPSGDLVFSNQVEIDNFLLEYPNCTEISGNVNVSAAVFNLLPFQNITSIEGRLVIASTGELSTLSGLNALTNIGGLLTINNNLNLNTLSGLEGLSSIGGNVVVAVNSDLTNLLGLENLTTIGGDLNISFNNNLIDLSGLENIVSFNGDLTINENDNLISLSGLENLTSLNNLNVSGNNLTNLSGLENITTITGGLQITENLLLNDLEGLQNVTEIGGLIRIFNNPMLSECSVSSICNYILNGGAYLIFDNLQGCNTIDELLANCSLIGKINHPIFFDLNENGIKEADEPFYSNTSVTINPENFLSYGNLINGGMAYRAFGNYTISYNSFSTPNWELTTPNSYNVTLTETNPSDTVYFGLKPTNIFTNLQSSIATTNLRCNESQTLNIYAENTGTTINTGTLWVEIDEAILTTDFIDTPDTIVAPIFTAGISMIYFPVV